MRYPQPPYDPVNGDTAQLFPPNTGGRVAPAVQPRQPNHLDNPMNPPPFVPPGIAGGPLAGGSPMGGPVGPLDDTDPGVRQGIAAMLQQRMGKAGPPQGGM